MRIKVYVWRSSPGSWFWEVAPQGRPRPWRTHAQPIDWGIVPTFEQAIADGRASLARVTR